MNKIFKIGDVVELKSGGPKMTIEKIKQQYDNGIPLEGYDCFCVYFLNKEIKYLSTDQLTLKTIE